MDYRNFYTNQVYIHPRDKRNLASGGPNEAPPENPPTPYQYCSVGFSRGAPQLGPHYADRMADMTNCSRDVALCIEETALAEPMQPLFVIRIGCLYVCVYNGMYIYICVYVHIYTMFSP